MTDGDPTATSAADPDELDGSEAAEVEALIQALLVRFGHDFRGYSRASLSRRLRAAQREFDVESLSHLQHRVLREDGAIDRLIGVISVPTTEMFRHPPTWRLLREQVVPRLLTYARPHIWVAGCSTGQEVYSLAILLEEEGLRQRCVIHATDLNRASLQRAKEGIVEADQVRLYTENYQLSGGQESFTRYFSAAYGLARIQPELLSGVSFHHHSLATDGVFAQTQLVLCRNVLIYFDQALQARAVGLFRESLVRRGFLCLGSRESLHFTGLDSEFGALEPGARVYQLR